MKYLFLLLLMSSCTLRFNKGEDLFPINSDEIKALKGRINYFKDNQTGLCFAVWNNHTDGYRSTFITTCVPCDSLKNVIVY